MKRTSVRTSVRTTRRSSSIYNNNIEIDHDHNDDNDVTSKEQILNQSFLDINNDTSWMINAIDNTCQGYDWNKLLEDLYNSTSIQLNNMNYNKRFSELNDKEQNILIESQYQKMCDEGSLYLSRLDFNFSKAIDNELVKLLRRINNIEHDANNNHDSSNSNNTNTNNYHHNHDINDDNNNDDKKETKQPIVKNRLLEVTMNAVIEAFDNSPPEFAAAPKIFLNRPLLPIFRPYVWNASLLLSLKNMDKNIDFTTVSSRLDETIPRRCHSLLDKHYEKMSSRWMAGIVTETMMKFMHINNIKFPKNEDDCHNVDVLFFLIIPLIDVFSYGKEGNENKNNDHGKLLLTKEMDDKIAIELMIKGLTALLSSTQMNLLKAGKGVEETSPVFPRIELYLNQKDEEFLEHLNTFHLQNKGTYSDDFDYPEWKSYFNSYLLKGLSSFLVHDTLLFVWDQGYIMSFHKALSIVFTSLLLSFKDVLQEPVDPWPNARTAFDTFCTYCSTVTVSQLQKLLSQHFSMELGEEFDQANGFSFEEEDDILMAVYKKIAPDAVDVEALQDDTAVSRSNTSSHKSLDTQNLEDDEHTLLSAKNVVRLADVLDNTSVTNNVDDNVTVTDNDTVTVTDNGDDNDDVTVTDDQSIQSSK